MTRARGRPLRFLGLVTVGWVGMRVTLLWPEGVPDDQWVEAVLPTAQPIPVTASRHPVPAVPLRAAGMVAPRAVRHEAGTPPPSVPWPTAAPIERATPAPEARVRLALLTLAGFSVAGSLSRPAAPPPALPRPASGTRPTVSVWALARPGSATGGPVQLGGGQAGLRVRMPVTAGGRTAVVARIAAPLAGQGREAAFGVEWRPVPASVAVVVERRLALDRGRNGTGLGLIAGIDRALPGNLGNLGIEAYGQAGAVARDGIEPYADGAARILHPVATIGGIMVKLGVGGWGGAQREAMRVDVGPALVAAIPVGRSALRLSVDWRQRVAGNAAPGSGPALTIGSDF